MAWCITLCYSVLLQLKSVVYITGPTLWSYGTVTAVQELFCGDQEDAGVSACYSTASCSRDNVAVSHIVHITETVDSLCWSWTRGAVYAD